MSKFLENKTHCHELTHSSLCRNILSSENQLFFQEFQFFKFVVKIYEHYWRDDFKHTLISFILNVITKDRVMYDPPIKLLYINK